MKRGAAGTRDGGVPTGPERCRAGQGDRGRRRSTAAGPAGRAHIKEDDLRFAVRMISRTGTPNTEPGKGGRKERESQLRRPEGEEIGPQRDAPLDMIMCVLRVSVTDVRCTGGGGGASGDVSSQDKVETEGGAYRTGLSTCSASPLGALRQSGCGSLIRPR